MKKIYVSFLFLFLCIQSMNAQKDWMTFTSDLGKFSIEFEGDLKQYFKIHQSGAQIYECMISRDGLEYGVDWMLFKGFSDADPELLLEKHIESRIQSYNGTKIFVQDIDLPGAVAGKYFIIQLENGTDLIEAKSFVNGSILYNVSVKSTKEAYNKDNVEYFLNSFKIID